MRQRALSRDETKPGAAMGRRRATHRIWGVAACTTVALGLACDAVVWGAWGSVAIGFAVGVLASLVAVLLGKSMGASSRIAVKSGLVVVSCAGLVVAFRWSGVALVLMVGLTAPVVRILLRGGRMRAALSQGGLGEGGGLGSDVGSLDDFGPMAVRTPGGALRTLVPLAEMPDADGVPTLDDGALCQAWRRSYVRLQASRAAEVRLHVVRLRQLYLDELVRRHPAEVQHWLASGARAAGNPLPYLERPAIPGGPPSEGEQGRESEAG